MPQSPACFLVEASRVDGTLKSSLKLRECPVAGSRSGQVFAPVSTINVAASKMLNYLYVGSSWQEFSVEGKNSSSGYFFFSCFRVRRCRWPPTDLNLATWVLFIFNYVTSAAKTKNLDMDSSNLLKRHLGACSCGIGLILPGRTSSRPITRPTWRARNRAMLTTRYI